MKKLTLSKIGIAISIILFITGVLTVVPNKEIDDYTTYVGGDAYNIQIEATLLAAEITGSMIQRSVFIAASLILFFFSYKLKIEESQKNIIETNKVDLKLEKELVNSLPKI